MPKPHNLESDSGQTNGDADQRKYARLEIAGRFKDMAAQLFDSGMFDATTQALLEFTDNAAGARDRENGVTRVLVSFSENRLRIAAFDETGMGDTDIQKLFRAGETGSLEKAIGTKGVGAKFATFALAKDLESLTAKLPGSKTQWKVSAPGLGDETIDYTGTLAIDPEPARDADIKIGIVDIVLKGMKWKNPPSATQLARDLGTVYAPILIKEEGKWTQQTVPQESRTRIAVQSDGKLHSIVDRIQIYVVANKKVVQAVPAEYRSHPGIEPIDKIVVTSENEPLHLKAQALNLADLSITAKPREKAPGGNFYYDGRLVERGFYPDTPDMRDTAVRSRLRFEIDVTQVQNLKDSLQMNKSAGIRPGPQRQRILDAVSPALIPLVEAIKTISAPPSSQMSSRFRDRVQAARQIADAALRRILEDGDFELDPNTVNGVLNNMRHSQERPTTSDPPNQQTPKLNLQGKQWQDQVPRTIPTKNASPDIPRRRITPYTPRLLELEEKATSRITVEGQRAYLDINSGHRFAQYFEMMGALDHSAGDIGAIILGATEQMRHLARELSEGDLDKEAAIGQAGLWAVAEMIANEPAWEYLKTKTKTLMEEQNRKKKK